jgi:hypothetical protein
MFCPCGNCENLPSIRECLCCKEFKHYDENYIAEVWSNLSEQNCSRNCICIIYGYKRPGGRAPDSLTMR